MSAFALEIENGIDHVFEHLGTRDRAFLGDVADQEQHDAAPLG